MSDQPLWEGPSGNWVQDDERKRFLILGRDTGGVEDNQSGLDVIAGAKWHSIGESECGRFFPPEFGHCPYCGKTLTSCEHQNDVWVPPYGDGGGLRLLSKSINVASIPMKKEEKKTLRWVDQEQDTFTLPRPRGDYEFIVGSLGTKFPALITFDRTTGLLDYFSPAESKWKSLTPAPGRRVGESRLPEWAWSAAFVSGKAGVAVPTVEGPVWIAIDWAKGTCTPSFGSGEAVGGPAALDNQFFVPVIMDGLLSIHAFDFTESQWKQKGESLSDGVRESGEARYYSVPVIDAGRHIIYWAGIDGLLTFDQTSSTCGWRPWETDAFPCRAVPDLGPPYHDPSGSFWQICYDDYDNSQDQRAFRYYKLSGDESDREDVDGGRFSSGITCCAKAYDLWEKPWAKKGQDQAKSIRVPLLCLDEVSKGTVTAHFGAGLISPLLDIVKDRRKTYQTDLKIEFPHDLPVELRMQHAFNISTPWELRLFIYQNHLYVYSSEEKICYQWRLK